MGADKKIKYDVTADPAGFVKGMEEAAAAAAAGSAAIQAQFGQIGAVFQTVFKHLGAIAGLLAGGAAFAKGVEATKELTGEATKLSKALGVSTEDASVLNVALRSIGSSADVYTDANAKLTKQIRTNEAAVQAMGVQTRGANGELLDGKTIMTNALTALKGYKEGTDRNLAGQQLFGKSAAEVTALLKLNAQEMEKARVKAEALGLVVGPEQAARVKSYKEAMDGVKLVLVAMQNAIGNAVMPVLTELAGWFNDAGPTAVTVLRVAVEAVGDVFATFMDIAKVLGRAVADVFTAMGTLVDNVAGREIPGAMDIWRNAMTVVRLAALALEAGFVVVFESIRGIILVAIERIKMFGAVAGAAFRLDWGGVQSAWRTGTGNVERIVAESQKRLIEKTAETAGKMAALLNGEGGPKAAPAAKRDTGGRAYKDPKAGGSTDNSSDLLKAQFALMKATLEAELTIQREYLAEAQAAYDDAYRHNTISTEQFYAAKLAIEQQGLTDSIRIKKQELDQLQTLLAKATKESDKLGLQAQEKRMTAELTVLEAKRAFAEIQNTRELTNALREKAKVMQEIQRVSQQQVDTALVDIQRINLQRQVAMREVSNAQALQRERGFQDQIFQIDRDAMLKRLEVEGLAPEARARINADVEQLERQHQLAMAAIDKDIAIESSKYTIQAQDAIEHSAEDMLANVATHAKTLKQAFLDVIGTIESELAKLASKQVFKELFGAVAGGGGTGNWLGSLLGSIGVPSLDVGTPYVPQDTFALIHKGERVVTAKDNASGNYGNGANVAVHNHFTVTGPVDRRTQQQIANAAWQGASMAFRRNG